jgi:hypothetical protein
MIKGNFNKFTGYKIAIIKDRRDHDMEEDTLRKEVEEVENQQDLTLLERFQQGLDHDLAPVAQPMIKVLTNRC